MDTLNLNDKERVCIVAHDLKNPLAAIRTAMQCLLDDFGGPLPERAREFIRIALRQSDSGLALVRDLLECGEVEGGISLVTERFRMSELIEAALAAIQPRIDQKGIRIVKNLDTDCILLADFERMLQVMTNLLHNAVKFSDEGGDVELTVSLVNNDRLVSISISDYGPGIPLNQQARIFEKFGRGESKNNREGFGLGLYIAREILKVHQGEIRVDSGEGEGATFTLTLPNPDYKDITVKGGGNGNSPLKQGELSSTDVTSQENVVEASIHDAKREAGFSGIGKYR